MEKWEEFKATTSLQMNYHKVSVVRISAQSKQAVVWMQQVEDLYKDYEKRIDVRNWECMMEESPWGENLGKEECSRFLLSFFMDHLYVPHDVLNYLENYFMWEKNREQLQEWFPYEYMEHILSNAKYEDSFRYGCLHLEENHSYDQCIQMFFKLDHELEKGNLENCQDLIQKLTELNVNHPDFIEKRIQFAMEMKDYDTVEVLTKELLSEYPDDYQTLLCVAKSSHMREDYNRAIIFYSRVLEDRNEEMCAMIGIADCYFQMDNLEQALIYISQAKQLMPYDGIVRNLLVEISKRQALKLAEMLVDDPLNEQLKLELVKALVDGFEMEQAIRYLGEIDENLVDRIEFHYVYARCYLEDVTKETKLAIPHLKQCIEWDSNQPKYYEDLAYCYIKENHFDRARDMLNVAKKIDINSVRIYVREADIAIRERRYDLAIEYCEQGLALDNYAAILYHYKAQCYYEKNDGKRALVNINKALSIMKNYNSMVGKAKIYNGMKMWEHTIHFVDSVEEDGFINGELIIEKAVAVHWLEGVAKAKQVLLSYTCLAKEQEEINYQLSLLLFEEGEYEKALVIAAKVVSSKKLGRDASLIQGKCYQKMKKYDEAIAIFLEELHQGRCQDGIYMRLGDMYTEKNDYQDALVYYNQLAKRQPQGKHVHGRLCDIYIKQKNYKKALEEANLQLKIYPTDYDYINRGIVYGAMDRNDLAKADYLSAISNNSENCYAWNNLGYLAVRIGDGEEIEHCFLKAYEYHHPGIGLYYQLGYYYQRVKDYSQALLWFQRAKEKKPDQEEIYLRIGRVYEQLGKYDKAKKAYCEYGAVFHNEMKMHCYLGDLYWKQGQVQLAEKEYQLANSVSGEKTENALLRLGKLAYIKQKNVRKALLVLKKANRLNKRNSDVLQCLGQIYESTGKDKIAKQFYWVCLDIQLELLKGSPTSPCIHAEIGVLYARVGQYEKAIQYLTKARELGPGCFYCKGFQCYKGLFYLGETYERMGKYQKAFSFYEQACKLNDTNEQYQESLDRVKRMINRR